MKHIKLYIIIIFTVVVLVCGCVNLEEYIPIEEYNFKISELEEANGEIDSNAIEILELKEEVNTLENGLDLTEEELIKYKNLINNLNELLSNIYIGYAENENWKSEEFTAFSLKYGDKIFLITAGHCVHYNLEGLDTGLYTTIKFKQNKGNWIYPKLLTYENDFNNNRDYAILYSDKLNNGLDFDKNNDLPLYILGNLNSNIIKAHLRFGIEGDSGSPIIDEDCKVVGLRTGGDFKYTSINIIIEAIDNLN